MNAFACEHARSAIEGLPSAVTDLPDEVALHLDRCVECRRRFEVGRLEIDPEALEQLGEPSRRAIIGALAQARSATRRRRAAVVAAAASAAAVLAAVLTLVPDAGRSDAPEVGAALVEDHIRYLHDPDRHASAEPATVVGALDGYVDFLVRLPVLADLRLTGGRRCYLLGRRVVLAFYDTSAGPVSYFAFETDDLAPPGSACPSDSTLACHIETGYRIVSWEEAGLLHAVVGPNSDALEVVAASARAALRP